MLNPKEDCHDRRGRPDKLKVEKIIHLSILRGEEMRPRRYPYSGKIKASTSEIVKAWEDDYSEFIVKTQNEKEKSEQKLDDTILRVHRIETLTHQCVSANH